MIKNYLKWIAAAALPAITLAAAPSIGQARVHHVRSAAVRVNTVSRPHSKSALHKKSVTTVKHKKHKKHRTHKKTA